MNITHSHSHSVKIASGGCPHGLPYGACPVCSGMGGGGGGAAKKASKPEMSWSECYAVWQQMLKAKDQAHQQRLDAMQNPQISFAQKIGNLADKMANLADKINIFATRLQNVPKIISTPILLATKFLVGFLNITNNLISMTQKALNAIQQKLADISDKLNAIFGEMKNFMEKNISDKLKSLKKKFKSLFGLFEPTETEKSNEEEKQIEESKRLFEMKTITETIKEKFSKKEE